MNREDEEWDKWNKVRFYDDGEDEHEALEVAAIITGAAFIGIIAILLTACIWTWVN